MDFREFAESHGLVIDHLVVDGSIHAVRTTDKPKKKNGRYQFDGQRGWCQNWATSLGASPYPPTGVETTDRQPSQQELEQYRKKRADERRADVERKLFAARIAAKVVRLSESDYHPYLCAKGFEGKRTGRGDYQKIVGGERGLIDPEGKLIQKAAGYMEQKLPGEFTNGDPLLVVPVRNYHQYDVIQSVQWVSPAGTKLFLKGGAMQMGIFRIGSPSDTAWFCEGYATGLTLATALKSGNLNGSVYVCFNDRTMAQVAITADETNKYVFADHDKVAKHTGTRAGQVAAESTELPWCQSPIEGEDANDLHQREGIYSVIKLMKAIQSR